MSFGTELRKTVVDSIPGVSTLNHLVSIAKDPIGAIFGRHSTYNFNPWHPPGEWRGKKARQDWERKRAALGYPPYTTALGREFKAYQAAGGSVRDFVPGNLSASSTTMPGGAQLVSERGGAGGSVTRRRSTGVKGATRRKKKKGRRKGKLKFGSPAWRRRYMRTGRRRQRRGGARDKSAFPGLRTWNSWSRARQDAWRRGHPGEDTP